MKFQIPFHIPLEWLCLTALFIGIGTFGPWWLVVVPAIGFGFLKADRPNEQKGSLFSIVILAAICAWTFPTLVSDFQVGWRISGRIAGVVGMRFGIFVYLLLAVISSIIASLGLVIGIYARLLLKQSSLGRLQAGKPTD